MEWRAMAGMETDDLGSVSLLQEKEPSGWEKIHRLNSLILGKPLLGID